MKYLVQWSVPQQTLREASRRFLDTGGKPPDGVTQLARWHGMNGKGFAVVEAADPKGVMSMVTEWRDVLEIEASPAFEDDELGEVLAKFA